MVQKGAHISLVYCVHRLTDCILPRKLGNSILGWWTRSDKHAISFKQVKKEWRQVNEKFFELRKGHIGIVEKAQETSSDSDMHNTVCLCHCSTS